MKSNEYLPALPRPGVARACLLAEPPRGGYQPPAVGSVNAISGIFDMRPIALTYVNEPLGLSEDEALLTSPLLRVDGAQGSLRAISLVYGELCSTTSVHRAVTSRAGPPGGHACAGFVRPATANRGIAVAGPATLPAGELGAHEHELSYTCGKRCSRQQTLHAAPRFSVFSADHGCRDGGLRAGLYPRGGGRDTRTTVESERSAADACGNRSHSLQDWIRW